MHNSPERHHYVILSQRLISSRDSDLTSYICKAGPLQCTVMPFFTCIFLFSYFFFFTHNTLWEWSQQGPSDGWVNVRFITLQVDVTLWPSMNMILAGKIFFNATVLLLLGCYCLPLQNAPRPLTLLKSISNFFILHTSPLGLS